MITLKYFTILTLFYCVFDINPANGEIRSNDSRKGRSFLSLEDTCMGMVPKVALLPKTSKNFIDNFLEQDLLIPEASPGLYDVLSYILTNKPFKSNDADKACFKRKFVRNGLTGKLTISGFGTHKTLACTTENYEKNILEFGSTGNPTFSCVNENPHIRVTVLTIFTDELSFAVLMECFGELTPVWTIVTRSGTIPDDIRLIIESTLGLHVFTFLSLLRSNIKLNYDKCQAAVTKHGHDGICDKFDPITSQFNYKRETVLQTLSTAYVIMASNNYFYQIAQEVGEDLSTSQKLRSLCPRITFSETTMRIHGFGKTIRSKCSTTDLAHITCTPDETRTKLESTDTFHHRFLWFQDSCALLYSCTNNNVPYWALLCKEKHASQRVRDRAVEQMENEIDFVKHTNFEYSYTDCIFIEGGGKVETPCIETQLFTTWEYESIEKLLLTGGWYITLGGKEYFDQMSYLLTGYDWDRSRGSGIPCFHQKPIDTTGFDDSSFKYYMAGFDTFSDILCKPYKMAGISGFNCNNVGFDKKVSWNSNAIMTDGKTFIVYATCFGTTKTWYVLTKNRQQLSIFDQELIYKKLGDLGIKGVQIEIIYESSCPNPEIPPTIRPPAVGPCFPKLETISNNGLQLIADIMEKDAYIPRASYLFYKEMSNALKGNTEAPPSGSGSSGPCLRRSWNVDKSIVTFKGYDEEIKVVCSTPDKMKSYSCIPIGHVKNPGVYEVYPAYVDRDFVLIVGCVGEGTARKRFWYVVSKEEHLMQFVVDHYINKELARLDFAVEEQDHASCSGSFKWILKPGPEPTPKHVCPDILYTDIKFTTEQSKFISQLWQSRVVSSEGSAEYFRLLKKYLKNSIFDDSSSPECSSSIFDESSKELVIKGYEKKIMLDCRDSSFGGFKLGWDCQGQGSIFKMKLTSIWTDGRTSVLYLGCSGDGKPFWFLSRSSHITYTRESDRDQIKKVLKDFGFNIFEWEKVSALSCHTDEGPGLELIPCANKQLYTTWEYESIERLLHTSGWYLTMGGKEFFDEISYLLTGYDWDRSKGAGVPCLFQKQTDQTGLHDSSFRYYISGFATFADILCKPYNSAGVRGFECNNLGFDKISWNSNAIHTDGKTFIAFSTCFGPLKTWFVLTKSRNQLSTSDQISLEKKLADLDLKGVKIEVHFGSSCPDPDTPVLIPPPAVGPCFPKLQTIGNSELKLISNIMSEDAYISRASYTFYKEMSQALKWSSEPPPIGSGPSGPCLRRKWNYDKTLVTFIGYDEDIKVACSTPDKSKSYSCIHVGHGHNPGVYEVYPAYVEAEFVLIVGCIGEGTARIRFWYVVSKGEHLMQFVVDHLINKELARLDFAIEEQDHATCSKNFKWIMTPKPKPGPTPPPRNICPEILYKQIKLTTEESKFAAALWHSQVVYTEGSPDYFRIIKKYLKNSIFKDSSSLECFNSTFDPESRKLVVKGYGKKKILSCNPGTFHEVNFGWDCRDQDGHFTMQLTALWTDARTSVVYLGCSDNENPFWVLARSSHITYTRELERDQIKKVIKNFGFDIYEWEKISSQHCDYTTYEVPGPVPCTNKQSFTASEYQKIEKLLHTGGWYITMGGKEFFDEISFLLTGYDWDRSKAAGQPCLYRKPIDQTGFESSSYRYYISGFDTFTDVLCKTYSSAGVHGFKCNNIGFDKISWNSNIILSDAKNFIAFSTCFGPTKSWFVLSKIRLQLSKSYQDLIYKKLEDLDIIGVQIHINFESSCKDKDKKPDILPPPEGPCFSKLQIISSSELKLIRDIMKQDAWIPRASYNFYKEISIALKRNIQPLYSGSGPFGPCLRRTWSVDKTTVTFTGYDRDLIVACSATDKMKSYSCIPVGNVDKPDTYEVYPAYVETEFILIIGCSGEGTARKRFWYVVSKEEHLMQFVVDHVINKELARLDFAIEEQDHATCSKSFKWINTPEPVCPDILYKNVKFTTEQLKFIAQLWQSRVVYSEGTPEYFQIMKKYLRNTIFDDSSSLECFNSTFDEYSKELVIRGYENKKIMNCIRGVFGDINSGWECRDQFSHFTIQLTAIWTDSRTSVVYLGCSDNGKPFWVLSRSAHITYTRESDRDQIKKVVQEFGFDIYEWEKISSEHCHYNTYEVRYPGPCTDKQSFTASEYQKMEKLLHTGGWYLTMGGKEFFDEISYLLTGYDWEQSKTMPGQSCLYQRSSEQLGLDSSTFRYYIAGFETFSDILCKVYTSAGIRGFECNNIGFDEISWNSNVILTDAKEFIAFSICFGPIKTWYVLSKHREELNKFYQDLIYKKLEELDITGVQIHVNFASSCPDPTKILIILPPPQGPCFPKLQILSSSELKLVSDIMKEDAWISRASYNFYKEISVALKGNNELPPIGSGPFGPCLRRTWNYEKTMVTFKGYDEDLVVGCSTTDKLKSYSCIPTGNVQKPGKYEVYPAYVQTDFVLIVGCSGKGIARKRFWYVVSKEEHLMQFVVDHWINKELSRLEFEIEEQDHATCSNNFKWILRPEPPKPIHICPDILYADIKFTTEQKNFIDRLWESRFVDPEGSPEYFRLIKRYLKDSIFEDSSTPECSSSTYSDSTKELVIKGYGKKKILDCKYGEFGDVKPGWICEAQDGQFKMQLTSIWTDGHSSVLFLGCSGDDKPFWFLSRSSYTTSRTTNTKESDRDQIKKVLKYFGFDIFEWEKGSGEYCEYNTGEGPPPGPEPPVRTTTKRTPTTVFEEEQCDAIAAIPVWEQEGYTRDMIVNSLSTSYIPLADSDYFYQLGEEILGRPIKSIQELTELCVRVRFSLKSLKFEGFGEKSFTDCDTSDLNHIRCSVFGYNNMKKTFHHKILWFQDGCAFSLSCVANGKINWALICKTKYVGSEAKARSLKTIQQLIGTHLDNRPLEFSYTDCEFFDDQPPDPTSATCDPTSPSMTRKVLLKLKIGLIQNVHFYNKCLRVVGGSADNEAKYQLATCDPRDSAQLVRLNGEHTWHPDPQVIAFGCSGKCMSAKPGFHNGVLVVQWDCLNQDNQLFSTLNGDYLSTFELQSKTVGKCVTPNISSYDGTVTLWHCHPRLSENVHQFWRIRSTSAPLPPCDDDKTNPTPPAPQPAATCDIKTEKLGLLENVIYAGKCLRVVDGSTLQYAATSLVDCDPNDKPQLVELRGENTWSSSNPGTIKFAFSQGCIEPRNHENKNFVVLQQNICSSNNYQNWELVNGNFLGIFQLKNQGSGQCYTSPFIHTHKGEQIQWECISVAQAPHQYWRILGASCYQPIVTPPTVAPPITTFGEEQCDAIGLVPISSQNSYDRTKIIQSLSTAYLNIAGTPNNFQLANEATGQQYAKNSDLATLCPKYVFSGNSLEIYGFGKKTPVNCDTSDLGHIRCKPDGTRTITDYTFHHSLIAFESDCVISVSCVTNGARNWAVLCPKPMKPIATTTIKYNVITLLRKHGIDVSYTYEFDYTNCEGSIEEPPPPPLPDDCIRKEKEGKPLFYYRLMPKAYDPAGEFIARYPDGCLVRRTSGVQKPYPLLGDPNGRYPDLSSKPAGGGDPYPNAGDQRRDSCLNIPMANKYWTYNYGRMGLSPLFAVKVYSNGIFFVLCCYDYGAGPPQLQHCNQVTEEGLELSCGIKPNERDSWPYRYDDVPREFKTCLDSNLIATLSPPDCLAMHKCFCGLPGVPPTAHKVNGIVTC